MSESRPSIRLHDGDWREAADMILPICETVFPAFDASYLMDRLPFVEGRNLLIAELDGRLVGFKLAYARGRSTLYSWLGGVLAESRGAGIAKLLMDWQHRDAGSLGYAFIETRTRAENVPMLVLNLRSGFRISAFEIDRSGREIVSLRKALDRDPPVARPVIPADEEGSR